MFIRFRYLAIMNKSIIIIGFAILLLGLSHNIYGQTNFNLDKNGLAIQGYDPVSYFLEKMPKKGDSKISFSSEGRTYYFSSEGNKKTFEENPDKYEPAYGGWCAYAIGLDASKVKIDPKTYKIVNGELLLFYNFFFVNTLDKWNDVEAGWDNRAKTNWVKIMSDE